MNLQYRCGILSPFGQTYKPHGEPETGRIENYKNTLSDLKSWRKRRKYLEELSVLDDNHVIHPVLLPHKEGRKKEKLVEKRDIPPPPQYHGSKNLIALQTLSCPSSFPNRHLRVSSKRVHVVKAGSSLLTDEVGILDSDSLKSSSSQRSICSLTHSLSNHSASSEKSWALASGQGKRSSATSFRVGRSDSEASESDSMEKKRWSTVASKILTRGSRKSMPPSSRELERAESGDTEEIWTYISSTPGVSQMSAKDFDPWKKSATMKLPYLDRGIRESDLLALPIKEKNESLDDSETKEFIPVSARVGNWQKEFLRTKTTHTQQLAKFLRTREHKRKSEYRRLYTKIQPVISRSPQRSTCSPIANQESPTVNATHLCDIIPMAFEKMRTDELKEFRSHLRKKPEVKFAEGAQSRGEIGSRNQKLRRGLEPPGNEIRRDSSAQLPPPLEYRQREYQRQKSIVSLALYGGGAVRRPQDLTAQKELYQKILNLVDRNGGIKSDTESRVVRCIRDQMVDGLPINKIILRNVLRTMQPSDLGDVHILHYLETLREETKTTFREFQKIQFEVWGLTKIRDREGPLRPLITDFLG